MVNYICNNVVFHIMNLKIPPEPIDFKERVKKGLEVHRDLEIANLKQGTWIASPLWKEMGWGSELKKYGFRWQDFMKIIRDHFPYFYDWVNDKITWNDAIRKLIERIEDEIKAMEG